MLPSYDEVEDSGGHGHNGGQAVRLLTSMEDASHNSHHHMDHTYTPSYDPSYDPSYNASTSYNPMSDNISNASGGSASGNNNNRTYVLPEVLIPSLSPVLFPSVMGDHSSSTTKGRISSIRLVDADAADEAAGLGVDDLLPPPLFSTSTSRSSIAATVASASASASPTIAPLRIKEDKGKGKQKEEEEVDVDAAKVHAQTENTDKSDNEEQQEDPKEKGKKKAVAFTAAPAPPTSKQRRSSLPSAKVPVIRRKKLAKMSELRRTVSAKLQRRNRAEWEAQQSAIAQALPSIPEGPSPRRKSLRNMHGSRLGAGEGEQPPVAPPHHQHQYQQQATTAGTTSTSTDLNLEPPPYATMSSPHEPKHRSRLRRHYEPSLDDRSSILDPPNLPPPTDSYVSYGESSVDGTLPRSWSPSRASPDFTRPPPVSSRFEPADINGSPRPGTPASTYGGSPRRPLPPAPLFSSNQGRASTQSFADDVTVSIPLGEDDPFGPESDVSDSRRTHGHSYGMQSAVTLSEDVMDDETTDISGSGYDAREKVEYYGPAPEGKQERRGVRAPQMSKKEVVLINGELVLECKIPTILYSFLPRRDEVEFTHMRYTAVTCDPDDFVERGYKLRQNIGRTARETELFICVTMYNEDEYGFTRTMHAIMKNISHFCARNKSRTWGENGWQKIVVCVVSDGREKIHPRTLDALAAMGVYQHGIAKNYVNSRAVQAHVYEYTTQVSLDSDLKFKGAEKGIVPCQMIFCLKEKNQKKLNSHRWFFNAFGKALNPNVCILLDVGTRPGGTSLYHLWKAFDTDSNVAGACGEIKAMKGKWGINLLNPLVASQNFEYKMSNILDKPLESVFGYITVLPGALSAYRYHALQNDETGHGPLSQYFKGETLHGQHADVFTANMYLAEDRILCWELVAKRGERWVLKYVKGCTGETDVPGESTTPRSDHLQRNMILTDI